MSTLNSVLNAVVITILCVAAYFFITQAREPIEPPNDAWFQTAVIDRHEPVLVKFGANWCGPCRAMEPELSRFSASHGGSVGVVQVDVDQHRNLAQHYHVSSIPRLFLFQSGKVIADRVGFMDAKQLDAWVQANR
jgi:thioredoxin 1